MIFHAEFLVDDETKVVTDVISVREGSRLDSRSVSLLVRRCFVPSHMNCVLPALRESWFEDIHS